ncbi:MAG TPA: thioesterase family protein, partial [Dehalococcoidia bacterium]|nr:thioesterase family protein [Dehalococcoidia bacterium]
MPETPTFTEPDPPFRFRFRLRVRFAETDAQGVVFNGNYFTYFDTAIVEYCRAIGQDYVQMVAGGVDFALAEAKCRFAAGAVFDEPLGVDVRTVHLGRTSWVTEFRIVSEKDGRIIATAQ